MCRGFKTDQIPRSALNRVMMLPVEVVMAASTGSISPKYMAQFKRNGWLSFRGTVAQSGRNIHPLLGFTCTMQCLTVGKEVSIVLWTRSAIEWASVSVWFGSAAISTST